MTVRWGRDGLARPRGVFVVITVLVAGLAAFLTWAPAGAFVNTVVADSAVLLAALAASVAFAWRARQSSYPGAWWLLSAAALVFAGAEAYWFVLEVVLRDRVAAVSWADAGYYAGYVVLFAALLILFPSRSGIRDRWRRLLDIALLSSALLVLVWMLALFGAAEQGGLSAGEKLLIVAYPALDLATGATVLVLARELTGIDRQRILMLGGGLLAWAVADVLYAREALNEAYVSGFPFDALWVGGYLLAGASGAIKSAQAEQSEPAPQQGVPSTLAANWTYLAWAFVLPVGIYHYLSGHRIDGILFITGMVLIAATVGRHMLLSGDLIESYRRAEAKERQLKAAQTVARIGSWEYDFASGEIRWSDETFRIFGKTPDGSTVVYERFFDLVHPDDRERLRNGFEASVQAHRPYNGEHRILLPDGQIKWVHERGQAEYDGAGRPIRAIGTVQDIDDRKRIYDRLRESEERLRSLVENMEECFFSSDASDPDHPRLLYVSHRWADIYGRPVDELYANPMAWLEAVHPDDKPLAMANMDRLANTDQPFTVRYRIVRPDGDVRTIETYMRPIRDKEAGLLRVDGLVRDVTTELELAAAHEHARTQEVEAARLRELDELKTTFLNTAAHELATPLTPIKVQLAILNAQHKGDPGFALLTRNIGRLERLVRDLLDASRLQAGRMSIHPSPRQLHSIISDALGAASLQARHAGIHLNADVPPQLEVEADELRISQVINNLLNNAIKFTPEGGHVDVTARNDGGFVRIDITDTGMGMEPAKVHLLFHPFQQLHAPGTATETGTGLGLFISKGIIERHGGTIEARSPGPGQGSTFTIRIPQAHPAPPADPQTPTRRRTPTVRA